MTTTRPRKLTDEERTERRQRDRETAEQAVASLLTSEGWRAWLRARGTFHRYSFVNQCLIAMQAPDATRVAGFRAWLKLGYSVRRGERAIRIWVPLAPSRKAIDEWRANGSIEEDRPRTWFKLGPVFDRAQVEELPPPATPAPLEPPIEPVDGDSLAWALAPLVALGASIGSTVTFESIRGGADGFYEPASRRIAVEATLPANGRVRTLVHELAHALVRFDRQKDDPKLTYDEEELVVESVAYTVCGSIGLDTTGASIPYLASWAEDAKIETIQTTAELIDRLARRIEDAVLEHAPGETDAAAIAVAA